MNETKHSPLPFVVSDVFWIEDANGNDVASCVVANVTGGDGNNAAFIVRACNAHDDLLALAKRVVAGGMSFPKYEREMAKAAVAKACGETPSPRQCAQCGDEFIPDGSSGVSGDGEPICWICALDSDAPTMTRREEIEETFNRR